jgi:hypothetical protein
MKFVFKFVLIILLPIVLNNRLYQSFQPFIINQYPQVNNNIAYNNPANNNSNNSNNSNNQYLQFNNNPANINNNPDKVLNDIKENIFDLAEKLYRDVDLNKKRILAGDIPDSYPKEMKRNALLDRQNHNLSDPIMLYPTAIWRSCIFPNFKISYVSLCRDRLGLEPTTIKLNGIIFTYKGCLHNFCVVCCDHLIPNYGSIASTEPIGQQLNLNSNEGLRQINHFITNEDVNECRNTCNVLLLLI